MLCARVLVVTRPHVVPFHLPVLEPPRMIRLFASGLKPVVRSQPAVVVGNGVVRPAIAVLYILLVVRVDNLIMKIFLRPVTAQHVVHVQPVLPCMFSCVYRFSYQMEKILLVHSPD